MTMPASDLHNPEDRDATGVKVKYLYCPDCGHFSGGGVCRVCERGLGEFVPPAPETASTTHQRKEGKHHELRPKGTRRLRTVRSGRGR